MHKITAIEPQKKNPQRVSIHLNGEYAFGLSRIVAAWLEVGQELSDEKISTLQKEDEREVVYQKALHFLSFRPRSVQEVRRNLEKKKIPAGLIDETLERLRQGGLIDDEAFTRMWIENRSEFRPRSSSMLRMELVRKGVEAEVIQSVLDEGVDDESLAFEAARKYAHRLEDLDWQKFRSRLGGFLARRGFSYSTISPLLSKIWKEIQAAGEGQIND